MDSQFPRGLVAMNIFLSHCSRKTWQWTSLGNEIHVQMANPLVMTDSLLWKSPLLMGKPTISMAIFSSYISHYRRVSCWTTRGYATYQPCLPIHQFELFWYKKSAAFLGASMRMKPNTPTKLCGHWEHT